MHASWPIDGSALTPTRFRHLWMIRREARARMSAHRSQIVARLRSGGDLRRYHLHQSALQADASALAIAYHEETVAALRKGMTLAEAAGRVVLRAGAFDATRDGDFDRGLDRGIDKGTAPGPRRPEVQVIAADTQIPTTTEKRGAERAAMLRRLIRPKAVKVLDTRHEADAIAADLMDFAPWMGQAIEVIWRDMLASVGGPLVLRPLLLAGPPGCGKTALLTRLAGLLGLPTSRIEMSAATAVFDLTGLEFNWSESRPGEPISLIDTSGQATALMVLDEVEKAPRGGNGGDPLAALLPLLNRDTARNFRSPWLCLPIDLSHLSWVLTANDLTRVPRPLRDRLRVIEVGLPGGAALQNLIARVLGDVDLCQEARARIAAEITAGRLSLRGLGRIGEDLHRLEDRRLLH